MFPLFLCITRSWRSQERFLDVGCLLVSQHAFSPSSLALFADRMLVKKLLPLLLLSAFTTKRVCFLPKWLSLTPTHPYFVGPFSVFGYSQKGIPDGALSDEPSMREDFILYFSEPPRPSELQISLLLRISSLPLVSIWFLQSLPPDLIFFELTS